MSKLTELKAAHEAATPGEWDYFVGDNATPPYCSVTAIHGDNILRHRLGVTGQAQNDVMFVALAYNMMPLLLEAVTALKGLQELALEMGHEIRALDENSKLLGYWTNDGEYIIDERFGRADRLLEKLK